MKALLTIFIIFLTAIPGFSQDFWLTTPNFPAGPKTAFVGMEDSVLFVGTAEGIWKSKNEGDTWEKALTSSYIYSMYATSEEKLIAGGFGKIFFSLDKGATWDSVKVASDLPITKIVEGKNRALFFISSGFSNEEGFVGDGVFHSNGDLKSWVPRNNGVPAHLRSGEHLAVDKNGRVYVTLADENTSGQGGLYFSDDEGLNWQQSHFLVKDLGTIKALNSFSISITPEDSVIVSVNGTVTNFSARLNLIKQIDEIPKDTPWQALNVAGFINWWEDLNLNTIHFARNGDWYSSVSSPISSGGAFISKDKGLTWEKRTQGLGISLTDRYEQNFHYESSEGKIFLVQQLDERVYFSNQSLLNPVAISGRISDDQGKSVAGVSIAAGNIRIGTDSEGGYSLSVPFGWSGTITPTLGNHEFSPKSVSLKSVQNTTPNIDFVGTYTGTYFISGYVKDISGQPIAQIEIEGFPEEIFTNEFGFYVAEVPARWKGTITPVRAGYEFSPSSIVFTEVNSNRIEQNFAMRKTGVVYVVGEVRDENGQPFLDVTLDGFPQTTRIDATGNFYGEVPLGWTGTIVPEAAGYKFSPQKIQVTNLKNDLLGQKFVASQIPAVTNYIFSGRITDQGRTPIADVSLTGLPFETKTNADGTYLAEFPSGWSGMVTPISEKYVFSPKSITINNLSGDLSDQDFTASIITGIDDEPIPFSVYPNPSQDGIIYISPLSSATLRIFTSTGVSIWSGSANTLPIFRLPQPGVYIFILEKEGRRIMKRVVFR
jgi:photosystem II stability/assembly factor-like uncharacterized protein